MPKSDNIRIHALPAGKVLAVTKAIRIDGTIVFQDAKGQLYCPRVTDRMYYSINDWGFTRTLLPALVKLGAIKKAELDEYNRICKSKSEREAADFARDQYLDQCSKYGLKVSKTHMRTLNNLTGRAADDFKTKGLKL